MMLRSFVNMNAPGPAPGLSFPVNAPEPGPAPGLSELQNN
jgi:hypothetical protein